MSPTTLGTLYCILSAVFYTLMGICQRELSQTCDPVLVNSVQASVSTVVFGVYLLLQSARGRSAWPPLEVMVGLLVLGAVTQLGGTSYQWSLGMIGLSIGNPLQMGVMLSASALLGWVVLREGVSWKGIVAIAMITLAIFLLSRGAEKANEAIQTAAGSESSRTAVDPDRGGGTLDDERPQPPAPSAFWVMLGVMAAGFSGLAFAILTVGMRKTATENTSPEAIVFFINCMGILFLGPWALNRLGIEGIAATSPSDLAVMLATGACNLLAFLLIAKALQLTTVVRVNVINNAMTTALTVLAGIVIFVEPSSPELTAGIIVILAGIVLISLGDRPAESPAVAEAVQTEEELP